MRPTTTTYMTDDEGGPLMSTTEVDTTEVEEREYRAYASLLGIEASAPVRRSEEKRMVRVSAAEVEELRRLAAFKDADPHDGEEDAYYRRHRSQILGVPA